MNGSLSGFSMNSKVVVQRWHQPRKWRPSLSVSNHGHEYLWGHCPCLCFGDAPLVASEDLYLVMSSHKPCVILRTKIIYDLKHYCHRPWLLQCVIEKPHLRSS